MLTMGCNWWRVATWRGPATDARFATPGVNSGLFCSAPMVALSRNLSRKATMEMLLLGEMVEAEEALRLGLVNRVVRTGPGRERSRRVRPQGRQQVARTAEGGRSVCTSSKCRSTKYNYTAGVMVENMCQAPKPRRDRRLPRQARTPMAVRRAAWQEVIWITTTIRTPISATSPRPSRLRVVKASVKTIRPSYFS